MARSKAMLGLTVLGCSLFGIVSACGGDTDGGGGAGPGGGGRTAVDDTGAVCDIADDCYPDVAPGDLAGDALCLDRVRDGYCTHECTTDADCCAAEGECTGGLLHVCSPFESTNRNMCFLSCESADVSAAGLDDDNEYCQREAGRDFACRSSGGGSANRKICMPVDCGIGAGCAVDGDCGADQECLTAFDGGYCGIRGCATTADCPANAACIETATGNVCVKTCESDFDCTVCRGLDYRTDCEPDVADVDGTARAICRPL